MNKVICDICGTMYPETAEQCPICGCAKQANAEIVTADTAQEETGSTGTYTYVKGGRFSKANVRKRNKANSKAEQKAVEAVVSEPASAVTEDMEEQPKEKSNRGLVITVIVLLLAIVAVVIYIGLRFFAPEDLFKPKQPASTAPSTSAVAAPSTTSGTQPQQADTSCTGLMLSDVRVTLDYAGQSWLLDVSPVPANTTDVITYSSSDEAVVAVSADGVLTAMGGGQAVVTISCGRVSVDCTVTCSFDASAPQPTNETTVPTETTAPAATVDPNANYTVLFYGDSREDNDVTLATGDSVEVTLEDDNGNVADVTWQADDTSVVEIDGTMFYATSPGVANVTATYGGKTFTIIFRVY